MVDLILIIGKYLILISLIICIYGTYTFIISPYIIYKKYKNHPNIKVNDKFNPLLGDTKMFFEDMKNGSVFYHSYRFYSNLIKEKDITLFFLGVNPLFQMRTPKAIKELEKLIPSKVDREADKIGFSKFNSKGFSHIKSTATYLERKKTYMRLLSIHSSSKYIPNILLSVKANVDNWELGKNYN